MVGKSRAQRNVVVVFDGVSLGLMSFAFGVFDLAAYYGMLPDPEPGGHYAAHQEPEVLVDDLREFYRKLA
jgi:hypothetical protein